MKRKVFFVKSRRKRKGTNTLAKVEFVLSIFIAIAGLICSVMGYRKSKQEGLELGGLALAGIIISAVSMAIVFLSIIIVIATLGSLASYY
ncbi:MAG: hypothetical protein NC132_02170 [Corallococcus sp.]|nr:hypothetical protein [Corallococcus sp.]MCM1358916.1 hypothetical protein [Corallococcus sp.]MCM1394904.1 hypothetical protein [Corallococcus sp.]